MSEPDNAAPLVHVRGEHRRRADSLPDRYKLTVYGVGEPVQRGRYLECPRFLVRLKWLEGAKPHPAKDDSVLREELKELKYRMASPVRLVNENEVEVDVIPVYTHRS